MIRTLEILDESIQQLVALRLDAPSLFTIITEHELESQWAFISAWRKTTLEYKQSLGPQQLLGLIKDTNTAYDAIIKMLSDHKIVHQGKGKPEVTGWMALMFAAYNGRDLILKDLLANDKNDINLHPMNRDTPLMLAVRSPDPLMMTVQICLESGANPNVLNHEGKTALDIANEQESTLGTSYIIDCLKKAGAQTGAEVRALKEAAPAPAAAQLGGYAGGVNPPLHLGAQQSHPQSDTSRQPLEMSEINNNNNDNDKTPLINKTTSASTQLGGLTPSIANTTHVDKDEDEKPGPQKNWASHFIDFSNRRLFEGLFDFFSHWESVWTFYRYNDNFPPRSQTSTVAHIGLGLVLRLLLLPLTATVYNLSRLTLIIGNPGAYQHNTYKALMMLATSTMALLALTAAGLFTPLFTHASLHLLAAPFGLATGLGATALGAVILGSLLSIGLACLLHAAKKMMQVNNTVEVEVPIMSMDGTKQYATGTQPLPLAPKHGLNIISTLPADRKEIAPYIEAQRQVLETCATQKAPAIWYGTYANTQRDHVLKPLLREFQRVTAADRTGTLTPEVYDGLVKKAGACNQEIVTTLEKFTVEKQKIVLKGGVSP